jgi:hypothetical protein
MLREILNPCADSPEGKLFDNALKSVQILKNRTDAMQEIVNLRAGIAGVQVNTFDMGQLIRDTLKSFAEQAACAGVEIHMDIPEGLPTLQADASRIERVMSNLVRNALEYAAEGRRVDVRAGCRDGWMLIEGPGLRPGHRPGAEDKDLPALLPGSPAVRRVGWHGHRSGVVQGPGGAARRKDRAGYKAGKGVHVHCGASHLTFGPSAPV